MKNMGLAVGIILCFLLQANRSQAQINKGELTKSQNQAVSISPDQKHHYSVTLDKNQFAFFRLMQKGVDMKITTYDPEGNKLEDFDSPNGKNGPELFSITSTSKGKYKIEVSPFDENEPKGDYTLAIQSVKPKATSTNEMVDEIFTPWDSDNTPGASVAILKDGKVIYKKGYGQANLEYDIPNTPSTIFHIASVSKQFTVFSVLLLEKAGKLSLDDDIRKYIPEVPDFGKTITLRHLASHTSGLRDQWNLLAMAGWRLDDVITKEHVLKLVSRQKELNFEPGEEYLYCNTGFTLLAEVVARVSESSFAAFTQAKIFEPLGMKNTLFYDDHEKIVPNRAYSYYPDGNDYKKSVLSYANVGATSLFTTVEDLCLWASNFSTLQVGDQAIIDKMNTLAVLNNGKTFGGALGQFVGKYKGLNEIQHGGADAGYRSYLTRFPDQNLAVAVFSNDAQFNSGRVAHQVVDVYLKDKIQTPPKKKKPKVEEPAGDLVIAAKTLESYVGSYELQPGFVIQVSKEGGLLKAKPTGQAEVKLAPLSETRFKVVGVEAEVEFELGDGEKAKLLRLHQGGQQMEARRIKAFDPSTVQLSDYVGDYYSEELATTYHLVEQEGQLIAQHSRLSDIVLTPSKEDAFSGNSWYFGQIVFTRDSGGKIIACQVSNGRVRNLLFEKKN